MELFHRSPSHNRQSILARGLLPKATKDHHYPDLHQQPVGVFALPWDGEDGSLWRSAFWPSEELIDCWQIDASGLEVIGDPQMLWRRGKVILEAVLPERLTLRPDLELHF